MNMTLAAIIVFVLLIIVIIVIINVKIQKSNREDISNRDHFNRRHQRTSPRRTAQPPVSYANTPVPPLLGIQPALPIKQTVLRLEQALTGEFTSKLKTRMLNKRPQMSPAEFEWKFLELKRYFLMTAVLKDVPMFSEAVDDIWHEMLMFTREYSQFGEVFLGSPIHHAPHTGGGSDTDSRAWFDWVYAHMFIDTAYSSQIWGHFFQYPLSSTRIEQLRQADEAALRSRRFNRSAAERYPEIDETISKLILQAKEQTARAISGLAYPTEQPAAQSLAYMPYMAGAFMCYSYTATDVSNFDSMMAQHYTEEENLKRKQDAASSSNSSGCGSGTGDTGPMLHDSKNNQNHGSHDHGGGNSNGQDSGGSSSNCSSGCGGGGD